MGMKKVSKREMIVRVEALSLSEEMQIGCNVVAAVNKTASATTIAVLTPTPPSLQNHQRGIKRPACCKLCGIVAGASSVQAYR